MRSQQDVAAMSCPVCRVPLAMSDRQGIEIDYCPQCRGVWLDRGELDKIIERSAPATATHQPQPVPPQTGQQGPWGGHSDRGDYGQGHQQHSHSGYGAGHYGKPHKRKKSWLEEIFD
ncbi:hypothetical protein NT2_04_00910 [Caenibius tardaugens NBRC 16725]|uniref:Transcription factor zinc-finger domain-containing protein n=1 Tax=Caenibius tardaugens NBRC 16725 TaxID=1219035 RepID=U2YJP5_9SPHN|nr:zf-TFIIB domain-containing protein [Caenibius tardaugens]AZI36217.1 hypothetical protein EGO55_09820 [Caenibius tardaugens NBRC 16725]GAD48680.1 hypothetical protein NT2_04_00910 [Caenibius tardaugens NBRC 16725]